MLVVFVAHMQAHGYCACTVRRWSLWACCVRGSTWYRVTSSHATHYRSWPLVMNGMQQKKCVCSDTLCTLILYLSNCSCKCNIISSLKLDASASISLVYFNAVYLRAEGCALSTHDIIQWWWEWSSFSRRRAASRKSKLERNLKPETTSNIRALCIYVPVSSRIGCWWNLSSLKPLKLPLVN